MHFEVEINAGRSGTGPIWYSLVEEDDTVCAWKDEIEARSFMQNDTRQLRLTRVDGARRETVY